MDFLVIAKKTLKFLVATAISVPVGKLSQNSVQMNLSLVSGKVNLMSYESCNRKRKDIKLKTSESLNGGIMFRRAPCWRTTLEKIFPYKLPLSTKTLLTRIHKDKIFGYVQCDLEVPDELRERAAIFPPIFQNFNVWREKIGKFKLEYAKKTRNCWNHIECWFRVTN